MVARMVAADQWSSSEYQHRKWAPGAVLLRVGYGGCGLRSSAWFVVGFVARGKRNSHLPCAWNTLDPLAGVFCDRAFVSHPCLHDFFRKGQNSVNAVS